MRPLHTVTMERRQWWWDRFRVASAIAFEVVIKPKLRPTELLRRERVRRWGRFRTPWKRSAADQFRESGRAPLRILTYGFRAVVVEGIRGGVVGPKHNEGQGSAGSTGTLDAPSKPLATLRRRPRRARRDPDRPCACRHTASSSSQPLHATCAREDLSTTRRLGCGGVAPTSRIPGKTTWASVVTAVLYLQLTSDSPGRQHELR